MISKGIIRRGNHFVFMTNAGWVLIDGPWFNSLKNLSHDGHFYTPIRIPYSEPLKWEAINLNSVPEYTDFKCLEWETIRWHPGVGSIFQNPYYQHYKYHQYLKDRTRIGFRVVGGNWNGKAWSTGTLPAYFNCAIVIDDWLSEDLIRQGY